MSLCSAVVAELERRGSGTVDDLAPAFPEHTRAQVWRALHWANYTGQIECEGQQPKRGGKGRGGSFPATYRAKPRRIISSVWDLALAA
jgi:hypothetical protein